jgi:hypothetical protein
LDEDGERPRLARKGAMLAPESGVGHISKFMLLTCAVMAAFVCLQACDQESSPVEGHEKDHGVEQPEPTTPSSTTVGASTSTSASANTSSMPTEEQAAQSEASCRLANYVANENLSVQQASSLSERVADRTSREMQADASLTTGSAKNAALDDLGVPRYPECKMEG